MPAKPFEAKNGLRTRAPGSLAELAIALGTDPDAANRTGMYSDLTAADESAFLVVGGVVIAEVNITRTFRLSPSKLNWVDYNYNPNTLSRGVSTNPDPISLAGTGIEVAAFSPSVLEEVSACVELNHDYAQGTDIFAHVHWYPTTTGAGFVRWGLEYAIAGPGDTIGGSATMTVDDTAGGVAWQSHIVGFPAISGAGRTIGDQIHFRFYRDATADTYGADAATATLGFHVQVDSLGSNLITSKD